jgi:putative membrane protein
MFRIIPFAAAIATACVISGAAAAPAAKPTDPQIAHIVYTADNLDIENAKQALDKSKNEQVRNFAQRMIGDHTSVNDQALVLVKKLNVTIRRARASPRALTPSARSSQALMGQPSIRPMSTTKWRIIRP